MRVVYVQCDESGDWLTVEFEDLPRSEPLDRVKPVRSERAVLLSGCVKFRVNARWLYAKAFRATEDKSEDVLILQESKP